MKKKIKQYLPYIVVAMWIAAFCGCKKEDAFLNAKPDQSLSVPATLQDLKLLMHNEGVLNQDYPGLGQLSSDDSFVSYSFWTNQSATERNAYTWAKVIYNTGANIGDWSNAYNQVYTANLALETLLKINTGPNQQALYNQIRGSALFFRAMAFYNMVQTFALPYDPATASQDPGVPLRLSTKLTDKSVRATEQDCYNQIIGDMKLAADLLPDKGEFQTSPSKAAALGFLSRVHLVIGDFKNALQYANSCLQLNATLQDFNKLNPNAFPVYPNFSPEELFHSSMQGYATIAFNAQVDPDLLQTFDDPNDLRKSIFFYNNHGEVEFNSQFDKNNNVSSSISTNEILLNKAECEARLNDPDAALQDLNALLITRWKTGTFKSLAAANADDALRLILKERRKELVFAAIARAGVCRLNKESRFAITLKRVLNGITYELPPNDPRYALPIPDNEIQLSGIPQNIR